MLMTSDPRGAENQRAQRMAEPTRGMVLDTALEHCRKGALVYDSLNDSTVRKEHKREDDEP
jgi:hypothetical protein